MSSLRVCLACVVSLLSLLGSGSFSPPTGGLLSAHALAASSTSGGGTDPADPVDVGTKVCTSEELQNTSCTNPGNCRNACAFWCRDSKQQCRACCQAFRAPSRSDCLSRCDEVWNP